MHVVLARTVEIFSANAKIRPRMSAFSRYYNIRLTSYMAQEIECVAHKLCW